MVKLRLQRRGRKKLPVYKIVAADSRAPRNGRFIEAVGQYRPLESPTGITLDEERIMHWLRVGAQPTDTVRSLLSKEGIMLRFHLMRKGKTEEEIQSELFSWKQARDVRLAQGLSRKQRRAAQKKAAETTEAPAAPSDQPASAE